MKNKQLYSADDVEDEFKQWMDLGLISCQR